MEGKVHSGCVRQLDIVLEILLTVTSDEVRVPDISGL